MHARKNKKEGKIFVPALKSALSALIITMAAVMVLALAVKNFEIESEKIEILNQIIKVVCCVWAAFFAAADKNCKNILCGGVSAVLYTALGFAIFSAVNGEIGDVALFACDMAMAFAVGILTALLVIKILKKEVGATKKRQA